MQNSDKVIEVSDITKSYVGVEAVRGITFEVYRNEIFGILGPNGAGKTTTLEIIESLKKQTSGTVKILGLDNTKDAREIKKRIGVQLQTSEYLPLMTLSELLKLFGSLYHEKVDPLALLKQVEIEDKADSQVKDLSGGQKQRFTLATALVHKPEILFLDEPTTGLDPQARRDMWALVKKLNSQNITIIITTHYMEEAEYLCHRVAIMDKGKILKINNPQSLIEELSKVYKLSFFVSKPLVTDFFKQFSGISNLKEEYPKVAADLSDIEQLPKIIEKLKANGVEYNFLNIKTARLEDVYLHLTGHEYSEE